MFHSQVNKMLSYSGVNSYPTKIFLIVQLILQFSIFGLRSQG